MCSNRWPGDWRSEYRMSIIGRQRRRRDKRRGQRWRWSARGRRKNARRLVMLWGTLIRVGRYRAAIGVHDNRLGRLTGAHRHRQDGALPDGRHESGRHCRTDQEPWQQQQRQEHPVRAQCLERPVHRLSLTKQPPACGGKVIAATRRKPAVLIDGAAHLARSTSPTTGSGRPTPPGSHRREA